MASEFEPRKIGRFEAWRRRTLAAASTYPLAVQPIVRWTLASHTEVESSAGYVRSLNLENWWVTHNRELKHRAIIVACLLLLLIVLWYAGPLRFVFYKGVGAIRASFHARRGAATTVCGASIAKSVPVPRGTDTAAYVSDEWRAANPHPFGNLTESDFARGHATLSVGWLAGEAAVLDLGDVEKIMTAHSENKRCVCAAQLGLPIGAFAFNGRMHWQTYEWLVAPTGQNRTCRGVPALYTQEHAKLLVRTTLCAPRAKAAVGLQFGKQELCCMEYCRGFA